MEEPPSNWRGSANFGMVGAAIDADAAFVRALARKTTREARIGDPQSITRGAPYGLRISEWSVSPREWGLLLSTVAMEGSSYFGFLGKGNGNGDEGGDVGRREDLLFFAKYIIFSCNENFTNVTSL